MDHHAPHWIQNLADATGRHVRWRVHFMELNLKILHSALIKHQPTDVLSRLPTNNLDRTMLEDDMPVTAATRANKQAWNSSNIEATDGSLEKIYATFRITR